MILGKSEVPAQVHYGGVGQFSLNSNDILKIETSYEGGGGSEELEVTVPSGKKWNVNIKIDIEELEE